VIDELVLSAMPGAYPPARVGSRLGHGTVRGVHDPDAVSPWLWVVGALGGAVVVALTGAAVWAGFWGLGSARDRAAANQMLQAVAGLLGGRFRERDDYPWYRRPAQYGAVEGEHGGLGDLRYELQLMPRNSEYCPGAVMLRIRSLQGPRLAGGRSELRVFSPERLWHWPDLADPGTLAGWVHETVATVDSGGVPSSDGS
jgi:hypothetical protein